MILLDLYPKKCKQCGKRFEASSEWAYKESKGHKHFLWFCSYHCIQAYRREKERLHPIAL